ncbi:MAG: M13 family metallopeptidase [Pyrinomonadaceae bacterium]|nr:M13 family metallopeptidase [Pyrinomonadaceae bacterium]MBP6213258.1 M13 family metallopeptidase [Pyrinomonadaceae bacterium]
MRITNFRFVIAIAVLLSMYTGTLAQSAGFDTNRMDRSVDACQDFFEYANGSWLKTTEIPPSEARWGTFNILGDRNNTILKEVLETAAKTKAPKGSDTQMIGDMYATCIDEASIEKAGTKPINKYLKAIDGIKTTADLQRQIAELHSYGFPAVFSFGAGPDLKASNNVIINAGQGGITLPNRDYYTQTDAKSVETRAKFVTYMTNMFKLLGDAEATAAANAAKVLELQTRLAKASLTPVERRNPDNNYNKVSVADAQALTPNFTWSGYFATREVPASADFNIAPPKFFKEVNSMLTDVSVADWKTYLRWMVVNSSAASLPKAFADENFAFFGKHLSGQKERQARWKTCVQNVDGTLGEALGMEYAKRAFTPAAKARMNVLIDNLMVSMKGRIDGLDWMSAETKKQAQAKLSTFKRKIGYPDVLRGYKGLEIKRDSYAGNLVRSNQFQIRRNMEDIGKPRDKTRMGMTPPTVNASYSSVNNDITFPAGILQPPFFNFDADDAINYGAIGGVIGHEITHGFDDSGSRFDADGNLKMWWTDADRAKFEERAACVVKQFNEYEVQPGLFINGKLTLGENIGDFAGLTVSYYAFKKSLEGKPRPADIDGFTPEQRFFLGWAQVWAGKYTPEAERQQVAGNSHSLPRWRVNGPMSNMPEFAEAFSCKAPQKMVRPDACLIW